MPSSAAPDASCVAPSGIAVAPVAASRAPVASWAAPSAASPIWSPMVVKPTRMFSVVASESRVPMLEAATFAI